MEDVRRTILEGALTRRNFVKRAAALSLAVPAVGSILAACGGDDDDDSPTATSAAPAAPTPTTQITAPDINVTPTAGATATPAPEPTSAAGEPVRGGVLTVIRSDEADVYDPALNDSNAAIWVIFSVYQSLTRTDETATQIEPSAAETWEISEDGLTASFTLRDGLKFSDGSDLTSEDVVYSLERARDHPDSPWSFTLAQAGEITASDAKTIDIGLTEVYAPFLAGISMFNSSIISKKYHEEVGDEGLATQPLGSGPFAVKEWLRDQHTHLVRNEYYFDPELPYLDEVMIKQVPDVNAGILQLQGGDIDAIVGQNSVPFNRVAELQGDSKLQVLISPAAYNYYARVNTNNEPLDDNHVRNALRYATDVETLIQTVQFGLAIVSNSILPRGALFWNPDQKPYPFDLAKAKEELAASKVPDGFEMNVIIVTGNAQAEAVATALKAMWAEINVDLVITPMDGALVREAQINNEHDCALGGWTNDMIDPDQILSYFVLPEASDHARTGYSNPEAEALVIAARKELDPEKRREMYYEVQRIWHEDGPLIPLYNIPYIAAMTKNVQGYWQHPLGPYGFNRTWKSA